MDVRTAFMKQMQSDLRHNREWFQLRSTQNVDELNGRSSWFLFGKLYQFRVQWSLKIATFSYNKDFISQHTITTSSKSKKPAKAVTILILALQVLIKQAVFMHFSGRIGTGTVKHKQKQGPKGD